MGLKLHSPTCRAESATRRVCFSVKASFASMAAASAKITCSALSSIGKEAAQAS
jgi:hypothetical protein